MPVFAVGRSEREKMEEEKKEREGVEETLATVTAQLREQETQRKQFVAVRVNITIS